MINIHEYHRHLWTFVLLIATAGCVTGVNGLSPEVRSQIPAIELSFGDVDNPKTLGLGESVTFSVYYQGQKLELSDCGVEKIDGSDFAGAEGGEASASTTTECTYTAPSTMPVVNADPDTGKALTTFNLNVVVEIADANPALQATLGIVLSEITDDDVISTCTTHEDCSVGELCHFGICREYADVGINVDTECDDDEDCDDYGGKCDTYDTPDGCQNFCVDESIFYGDEFDIPSSSEECLAIEGEWDDEDAQCTANDDLTCDDYHDDIPCNGTRMYAECSYLTQEQCSNYHMMHRNCVWTDGSGCDVDLVRVCYEPDDFFDRNYDYGGIWQSLSAALQPDTYVASPFLDVFACDFEGFGPDLSEIVVNEEGSVTFNGETYTGLAYVLSTDENEITSSEYVYSNGDNHFTLKFGDLPRPAEISMAFTSGMIDGALCVVPTGSGKVYINYEIGGEGVLCYGTEGTCSDYARLECADHYENLSSEGEPEYHRCFWLDHVCAPYGTFGDADTICSETE